MVIEFESAIEAVRFPEDKLPELFAASQDVRKTPVARGYKYVYDALNFSERDKNFWRGRTILDVGCGDSDDNPEQYFPHAFVTGIDPKVNDLVHPVHNTAHALLRGVVQRLPVQADAYDLVYSSWAFPYHIPEKYHGFGVFELLRAVTLHGEIYLLPRGVNTLSDLLVQKMELSGFCVEYLQPKSDSFTKITIDPYITSYDEKRAALIQFAQNIYLKEKIESFVEEGD